MTLTCDMTAILFCKLGQNYYETSFPIQIFCANLMKLAVIFQDLEHLYDFHRHVFIVLNIPCKFGEGIFINECDIKVYVKT